jgi:predicted unusual protein kinase regulating ubiquinone biosynthesis (AarF/ABC1/UbiB family)
VRALGGIVRAAAGERSMASDAPGPAEPFDRAALEAISEQVPFFRPIVERRFEQRFLERVIRRRLVPLLFRIAAAQAELRSDRAAKMSVRARALAERLENLDLAEVSNARRLFETVSSVSAELEALIDDADYLSFRAIGLLSQLRAATIAIRTSKALWTSIRVADAFREPELRTEALELMSGAEKILERADRGEDVARDLETLEERYARFARDLDERASVESGAASGIPAIRASRRIWSYRSEIERGVLERTGKPGPLTSAELYAEIRRDGFPPNVISKILEEEIVRALLAVAAGEKLKRGAALERIVEESERLAADISSLDPEELRDVDRLEATVHRISTRLDEILAQGETLAKPLPGPLRKLRQANDAIRAFRAIFTAMRLRDAVRDPAFRAKGELVADRIGAMASSEGELEARLGDVEAAIDDFGRDLEQRLKIETPDAIKKVVEGIRTARRAVRASDALGLALTPEVKAAFSALTDLEMPAAERGRVYDAAAGDPLREAVVGVLMAVREIDAGINFAELGRSVNELLRLGGDGHLNPYLARSPLAFLGRANFENAFREIDDFFDHVGTPEGRSQIDRALNVLRAGAAVERENLDRIAFRIPEAERVRVATAVSRYLSELSLLALEWAGKGLAEPSGEAAADVIDAMITTAEAHLDELLAKDPRTIAGEHVSKASSTIGKDAKTRAAGVGASRIPAALRELSRHELDATATARILDANRKLAEVLSVVETTDDSRDAFHGLISDVAASLRLLVHLVHFFGAASNPQMDAKERATSIRRSVVRMGPLFVKMMQGLVNMESLLPKLSSKARAGMERMEPIIEAVKTLQDEVEPLPWPIIKEQIESSLGMPLAEAFVWIDETPLKAGSMGQIHQAKIAVENKGRKEIVDVAVKVLRPGVDQNFQDTIRVTQLTLSVLRELLRLDVDGAILGDLKLAAESMLPMIERALQGFIETFLIEANFPQEAMTMKAFAKKLGADPFVAVPLVYDSHTRNNVITMQLLKGFKLSPWLKRYEFARDAKPLAEDMGPLDPQRPEEDAKGRAVQWIRSCTGVEPASAVTRSRSHGWLRVAATMPEGEGGARDIEVFVRERNGDVRPRRKLPRLDREATASRVERWAEKRFGLSVESVTTLDHEEQGLFRKRRGFLATIAFDHPRQEDAVVFVDADSGVIKPRSLVPDLTEEGVRALRDRLISSFVNQTLAGLLHGDPQEGNFFVLHDGKTVGLIDFGLALRMDIASAKAPVSLLAGALLGDARRMAEALLSMAILPPNLSERQREHKLSRLTEECRRLLLEIGSTSPLGAGREHVAGSSLRERTKDHLLDLFQRARAALEGSVDILMTRVGLAPQPFYVQAVRAAMLMAGNIAAIQALGLKSRYSGAVRRVAGDLCLYQAIAPFFGNALHARKSERIEKMSAVDVRVLAAQSANGSSRSRSFARTNEPSGPRRAQ